MLPSKINNNKTKNYNNFKKIIISNLVSDLEFLMWKDKRGNRNSGKSILINPEVKVSVM